MDIVDPRIEDYMAGRLARLDEPVLLEMEAEARERGFPIVGRNVGVTLEVLARSIGATRVVELGSGFGYSAYWFSRAVEPGGEVHCTDGDPENERAALAYLARAGLGGPIRYHVGDAVEQLASLDGSFDVVYNDVDKEGYPDAWRAARERVRPGGLYICDNVLWYGRVTGAEPLDDDWQRVTTEAVLEHNALVAEDERFISTIVPTRDGVLVAVRLEDGDGA
ncbi:MAG TPA: O-methyltransferase [Actinomycetota bacterium]|nr:O-methyltransferase [Actinomycetota bacterium]